jgi:fatty acid desaturase
VSKPVVGVISFVFFIIAFGLALGSEFQSKVTSECTYSRDISNCLAEAALPFLLVAQLFVAGTTRCLCCATSAYKSGAAHILAIVAFVFSWLFFAIAFLSLIIGAISNEAGTCERATSALFAAGAAFTFLTMLMSILYYILISKASISAVPYGAGGPAYGGQGNPPSVGLANYA